MGKYLGGSNHLRGIDYEWVLLMMEAKQMNIKKEDVRSFIRSNRKKSNIKTK